MAALAQPRDANVHAKMTAQEEARYAGRVMTWEITQAVIAVSITFAKIYAAVGPVAIVASASLDNAFFLVVGFYFGRSNGK